MYCVLTTFAQGKSIRLDPDKSEVFSVTRTVMINLSLYMVFLVLAVTTIVSPGPGVLMSLTNSIRLGLRRATPGIIGVSVGTLCVAGISATGLGMLLATSPVAYNTVKIAGIFFMFYLGWKKFRAKPFVFQLSQHEHDKPSKRGQDEDAPMRLFLEGVILQLSNPALIVFYITLFPQCIDPTLPYWGQFMLLTINYAFFVWLIHSCYGWVGASAATHWLKPVAGVWINRVSGAAFWIFGVVLFYALLVR